VRERLRIRTSDDADVEADDVKRFVLSQLVQIGSVVWRQLLCPVSDNYFSLSTTITLEAARSATAAMAGASPPSGRFWFLRGETGVIVAERGWESGKPVFGFPLFQTASPELWECGNLAAFGRDFQGARGKRGKPAFGFPRFPQPRHFHSSHGPGFSFSPASFHACSA
jgi:hypothetical protein